MYTDLFDNTDVPYGDNIFSSYSICGIKNHKVASRTQTTFKSFSRLFS